MTTPAHDNFGGVRPRPEALDSGRFGEAEDLRAPPSVFGVFSFDPVTRATAAAKAATDLAASERAAVDRWGGPDRRISEEYDRIYDALPMFEQARVAAAGSVRNRRLPMAGAVHDERPAEVRRRDEIWSALERMRAGQKDFLKEVGDNRDVFDARVAENVQARHRRDVRIVSDAGTLPWLAGTIFGTFRDPWNAATLPFGGPAGSVAKRIAGEAVVNMAIEGAEIPLVKSNTEAWGEDYTLGTAVTDVLTAGAGAAVIVGGLHLTGKVAGHVASLRAAAPQARAAVLDAIPDADLPEVIRAFVPDEARTPALVDALTVMDRANDVAAKSPFVRTSAGDEESDAAIAEATARMLDGVGGTAPVPRSRGTPAFAGAGTSPSARVSRGPAPSPQSGLALGADTLKAKIARVEYGDGRVFRNPKSSAEGLYQFTHDTWLGTYRAVHGETGETRAAILAKKRDNAEQNRLMDRLTADNARALSRGGHATTAGNLYLAHFLGAPGATKVLGAVDDMPLSRLVSADVMRANAPIKFRGKPFAQFTARDLTEWAHAKMGEPVLDAGNRVVLSRDGFADAEMWARAQAETDAATMARMDAEAKADIDARVAAREDQADMFGGDDVAMARVADDPAELAADLSPVGREDLPDAVEAEAPRTSSAFAEPSLPSRALGDRGSIWRVQHGPLVNHAPVMWRETDARRAVELIPEGVKTDVGEVFLADTPSLALGQGANKGVKIEFDTAGLSGILSKKKPVWELQYQQGAGSEYVATGPQHSFIEAAKAIRVESAVTKSRDYRMHLGPALDRLVKDRGWSKVEGDGFVTYERAGITPADSVALNEAIPQPRPAGMADWADEVAGQSTEVRAHVETFDDPQGAAAARQGELLTHDVRRALDDPDGDMAGRTFVIDGEEISAADLLAELDADDVALATLKACLA